MKSSVAVPSKNMIEKAKNIPANKKAEKLRLKNSREIDLHFSLARLAFIVKAYI